MKMNKVLAAFVAAGCAIQTPVFAADSDNDFSLEALLNTGFRASLVKAIDAKREAVIAQDTIVAEDVADFPDLNLAESIQRMPGVAITREGGEGRQISLRGVGPDYSRVQINGMETVTKSTSSMDSRPIFEDRAFDFNVFASEMFSEINILKSYSANLDEGGLGGTVQLRSFRPFDKPGFQSAINVSGGVNDYVDSISPRVVALASNTWGDWGASLTTSYSTRDTQERGFNTYRWRQRSTDNVSDSVDAETRQLINDGELYFSRGNRYTVWENTQDRIGLNGVIQYQPSIDIDIALSGIYGELNNDREEYSISTSGSSSTALGRVEALEWEQRGDHKEVVYGEYSDVNLRTEARHDIADTTYKQLVLDGTWQATEDLKLYGLWGYSDSEMNQPQRDKVYLITRAPAAVTTDFRNGFYGDISYGIDTSDRDLFRVQDIDIREDYGKHTFRNYKLEATYDINDEHQVEVGYNQKKFNVSIRTFRDENYISRRETPLNNGVLDATEALTSVYGESADADWLVGNNAAAIEYYGVNTDLLNPDYRGDTLEEDTTAMYVQYNYDNQILGFPVRANAGLRHYDTDVISGGGFYGYIEQSGSYSGTLPTFNVAVDVTNDLVWRASISENIGRQPLNDTRLRGGLSVNDRWFSVGGSAQTKPYEADNLETSLEWYFSDVGYAAIAYFKRDITGFTTSVETEVPFSETGLPLDILPDDQDGNTIYRYRRPIGTEDASISGIEVSAQSDFFFLPAPFDRMGFVANVTMADGDATYANVQGTGETVSKTFPGLSELSGNLTVYYEGEGWGARVAAAYRDDYISRVEAGLRDEDERGFHSTLYIDASASYQVSDNLKLSLEIINLTNEKEEQYSDSNDRPYNITTSGTNYFVGFTYQY